jgi:VanZ family protein
MSLFTSTRERRLWLWALAAVTAIYSTLGPAQKLAEFLRERNLLRLSFALALLVVGVPILIRWIKRHPGWREIGVVLGVAVVYGIVFIRVETPEERTHLIEYSLVAILIHRALIERQRQGKQVPLPVVLVVDLTVLSGWVDDGIQWTLPNRGYDPVDVGFNFFAALVAIGGSLALTWARQRLGQGHKR